MTACSSRAEHSADNRKTEVRLLPGRLRLIVGTKVLAAAHLALNQAGEGSSPSGPARGVHWWSSRQDTALVKRRCGFDPHPVLFCVFDNSATVAVPMM